MRQVKPVSDPAPSRWSYRLQRLMLTPLFRKALRFGLPFCVTLGVGFAYLSDAKRQERLVQAVADIRHQIETRPEFMVRLLAIEGASLTLEEDIREIFPYDLPLSSFDMELDDIHALVAELPPVAEATVRIGRKGVLVVSITERQPVALWRTRDGLAAVDIEGVVIRDVAARADRPDLPVIAGRGPTGPCPRPWPFFRRPPPCRTRCAAWCAWASGGGTWCWTGGSGSCCPKATRCARSSGSSS